MWLWLSLYISIWWNTLTSMTAAVATSQLLQCCDWLDQATAVQCCHWDQCVLIFPQPHPHPHLHLQPHIWDPSFRVNFHRRIWHERRCTKPHGKPMSMSGQCQCLFCDKTHFSVQFNIVILSHIAAPLYKTLQKTSQKSVILGSFVKVSQT